VQANETARMAISGIVMRPVNYRRPTSVVNHLTTHLDAVAGLDRTARRDADVVDDLERTGAGLHFEGLVHATRARSIKEVWARRNGTGEIHPCRRTPGVGCSQIHPCSDHARWVRRKVVRFRR